LIVDEVNGVKIRSMQAIADALFKPMDEGKLPEFVVIKCLGMERPIVLEGAKVAEAQKRVRSKYGLPRDYFPGATGKGLEW
jgi:hypothetical protein